MARTRTNGKTIPVIEHVEPVHADTDSMQFDLRSFLEMAGVQLPGWKRVLVSCVASFAAGYLIGSVASVLMNILFTGAIAVTGSIFFAWVLYSIGFIIALYCAFKAGAAIGRYIMSGKIDHDAAAAKAKVGSWFSWGNKKEIVAA